MASPDGSGKEVALPPPPPLRTGRDDFAFIRLKPMTKPRASGAGSRDAHPCPFTILACRLRPFVTLEPIRSEGHVVSEDAHVDDSTFICFSSREGSAGFLVRTTRWKSARFRGE